jgi:radical SAM protein with 4Fe4S-binding SPASM domain
MSKERALKSKSFCSALWTSIYQNPDGKISPCCVWQHHKSLGNVNVRSIDEIYSSKKVKKLKEKMLNGETLSECSYCNKIESDLKDQSSKSFFNDNFFEKINWEVDEPQFYYWDLRISNLCNFKCRMCGHGLSSEWYDDSKSLGYEPTSKVIRINDKSNFWEQMEFHYKYVESIYFAGGEPFLNEHHYKILESLVKLNKNDTKLIVNTNGAVSHWKNKKVLDYYKPFNYVVFGFSIDGSYEVGEYIRKGLDYVKWKENVKEYVDYIEKKDSWDITYLFQFAFGVTNFHNIVDFIRDLIDSNLINKYCQFNFQPIVNPIEQSVIAVPPIVFEQFKKDSEELLNDLEYKYNWSERLIQPFKHSIEKIIQYVSANPFERKHLIEFYKKQEELDKLRNENIYDIVPDYRKLQIDNDGKNII